MRSFLSVAALAGLALLYGNSTVRGEAPAKIKVLIITGDDLSVHNWKETTAAIRKTLVDSGRFDVQVSEDLKPLESAEALNAYDVLFLNCYNNRKAPLSDAAKQNFSGFVRGGKGLYVQHLASASYPTWDEFNKLCGRHFVRGKSGHPPRGVFAAKIADDKHPITAGLQGFQADDELYSKLEGSEPVQVLVEAYSDFSKKTEPLVFVQEFGKGRVVHSTLGHDAKSLDTPEEAAIIVRGAEWAARGKVAK